MSMTVSLRVQARGVTATSGQRAHDLRIGRQPAYVDADRGHLSSVVVEPLTGPTLRRMCEERAAQQPGRVQALRRDAGVSVVGVITLGREAQVVADRLTPAEQDALMLATAQAAAERLGVEVTGLVVHRDEAALHAHVQMPAYTAAGQRLTAVLTPALCSELQDIAGAAWEPLGITRGKKKSQRIADGEPESRWVHRTVKQLHQDLPGELEALNSEQKRLKTVIQKNARLAERAQAAAKGRTEAAKKAAKRLQAYTRRAEAAKADLERIERAKGVGGRLAAIAAGWTGKRASDTERVTAAEARASRAEREAARATQQAEKAVRAAQHYKGEAQALERSEERLRDQVRQYREATRGMSLDTVGRVVTRGLEAGQNGKNDRNNEHGL